MDPGVGRRPDRLTLAAFATLVLLGGANSVAVRFSNAELPPFWGAAVRFAAASALLFVMAAALHLPLPRGRALAGALLFGVIGFAASYALFYWGVLEVQASLAQTLFALVPLLTFFFALAHRVERFRWRAMVGGLVALGGVAVVFGEQVGAAVPLLSLLAIVASAGCAAESSVLAKWFPPSHPVVFNAVAMAAGAALLLALSMAWRESPVLPMLLETWAALAFLVIVGSVAIFLLFIFVLQRWTASAISYSFVLFPFSTVLIAAWLAGETITPSFVVGGALVLAGVYVGALSGGDTRAGTAPVTAQSRA